MSENALNFKHIQYFHLRIGFTSSGETIDGARFYVAVTFVDRDATGSPRIWASERATWDR